MSYNLTFKFFHFMHRFVSTFFFTKKEPKKKRPKMWDTPDSNPRFQ
jgi:hypothetical protein